MITILTATYNRAYCLPRLFESLQRQSYRDFEWIVIDDGSTDGTAELCEQLMHEASFPMRFFRQKNSGKHVAINLGANLAKGHWLFMVDSDDWLPVDGLQTSAKYLQTISADHRFAGVVGLRGTDDRHVLWPHNAMPQQLSREARRILRSEYVDATSTDYHYTFRIPGDHAEIVRTSLVQTHPFPVFKDERFMSEVVLWQSLANEGYLFRWFNTITYCGEYQEDGLTKNNRRMRISSPLSTAFTNNFLLGSRIPFVVKLKAAVSYVRYGILSGERVTHLFAACRRKPMFLLALPVAVLLPIRH